ncbi:MAG: glycosyl transferase family protein [Bryobacteraceae bacterium]
MGTHFLGEGHLSFLPHLPEGHGTLWVLNAFVSLWPYALAGLATILLFSGLDDFVPLLICLFHRFSARTPSAPFSLGEFLKQERRIAIFVPCWKESEVIANMVRHNLAAIRYRNFDFFLGAYPNDEATCVAVQHLEGVFRNVHMAACPHPGPTSKADCLNWIYQRMSLFEEEHGTYFDTIVLHDAEDLMHPDALAVINREREKYAMVQVPVLPLATPFHEFTHGVYCDEFSEFQTIDMPARQLSESFIPSSGVGTGFAREILERLASERHNLVFDPASLTEDYEIGVYIHRAGYRQLFAPLTRGDKGFMSTREYFPRRIRSAIRQRTRWVTGIALQCWERHGWRGSWRTRYWFWRDRKGLIANPLSLLTNILFAAGLVDLFASAAEHRPWAFAVSNPIVSTLCWFTFLLQCLRLSIRMACVAKIFGVVFALGVPLRCFYGNFVNCFASFGAMWCYIHSKLHRRPLVWLKTDHAYPSRDALLMHRRELADVLVSSGYISDEELIALESRKSPNEDLADFLLSNGVISEDELCEAISLQYGVPSACVDAGNVRTRIARSLPAHVEKQFGIVPFEVQRGRLLVAGARVPPSQVFEQLKSFTRLPIEFQLVTRRNYDELRDLL